MTDSIRIHKWLIVGIPTLLSLITFGVYYKTLWYDFIFDDLPTISQYIHIRIIDFKGQFFGNPRWISRLLNQVTFHFWGNKPFAFRLVTLLVHLAIGIMIFALLLHVFKRVEKNDFLKNHALSIATLTSMLFLLHPLQTQTVTYITQMQLEGFAVFFIMAVITTFVFAVTAQRNFRKKMLYLISFVLMAFAAGTKEVIVILPVLLVFVDWFFLAEGEWEKFKPRIWIHILYALILYGVLLKYGLLTPRYVSSIVSTQVHNNRGNILTATHTEMITWYPFALSQFKVLLHYLAIFFWPFMMCFDYEIKLAYSPFGADVVIPFLLLFAVAAGSLWLYFRYKPHILTFCIAWFFVAMLPRASIFPSTELICDYKTYPASFGICLALAYLIVRIAVSAFHEWPLVAKLRERGVMTFVGQLAFCCTLAWWSNTRTFVWSCEYEFWKDVLQKAPKSRVLNNYAIALWERGQTQEAMDYFHQAIAKDSWYAEPHVNLATIYQVANNQDKALEHYKRALEIGEGHPELFNNLGMLHFSNQSFDAAEYCFKEAVALRPHFSKSQYNLGKVYQIKGRREEALKCYEMALMGDYQDTELYYLHGSLVAEMGDFNRAIPSLEKIDKHFQDTAFLLGSCYYSKNNYAKAAENFAIAHQQDPVNKICAYNYAMALMNMGRFVDALPLYQICERDGALFPYAQLHRARCLYEAGLKDDAKKNLQSLIDHAPSREILGDALVLQRDLKLI